MCTKAGQLLDREPVALSKDMNVLDRFRAHVNTTAYFARRPSVLLLNLQSGSIECEVQLFSSSGLKWLPFVREPQPHGLAFAGCSLRMFRGQPFLHLLFLSTFDLIQTHSQLTPRLFVYFLLVP
eukprot:scpid50925/ scgid18536/ 